MISSSQNSKIKLVRTLTGRPKERRDAGAFLAEGVRLVEDASAANWPFRFILYSDESSERGKDLIKKLAEKNVEAEKVESSLLQSLTETETSQGIIAVLEFTNLPIPNSPNFILITDSIRDPGNLGALLRSADAAGVQAVLIPPETTDAFAPKVVRAGMGAHFRLPIHSMAWDEIRRRTKDLKIYLADMDGQSCWETDFKSPLALIVGGEAEGASEDARKLANVFVKIPMAGKTESLNAAVAGSVLMFEVMRQRTVTSNQ
ncbi:MAG: RNA methyltransferase [Chloroflexi bacterium]|nr:RNA methyltransferase [Chloroflexota bacterium]MBI1856174.1 RNA methyltransferase [Chloroflexota bacterium]MBI3338513.1 RNA methyltransferase [Chloroflexota bacterium]